MHHLHLYIISAKIRWGGGGSCVPSAAEVAPQSCLGWAQLLCAFFPLQQHLLECGRQGGSEGTNEGTIHGTLCYRLTHTQRSETPHQKVINNFLMFHSEDYSKAAELLL